MTPLLEVIGTQQYNVTSLSCCTLPCVQQVLNGTSFAAGSTGSLVFRHMFRSTCAQMMERGIQIKGVEDPDPRAFDTDAVLVSQEEIEEQYAQA